MKTLLLFLTLSIPNVASALDLSGRYQIAGPCENRAYGRNEEVDYIVFPTVWNSFKRPLVINDATFRKDNELTLTGGSEQLTMQFPYYPSLGLTSEPQYVLSFKNSAGEFDNVKLIPSPNELRIEISAFQTPNAKLYGWGAVALMIIKPIEDGIEIQSIYNRESYRSLPSTHDIVCRFKLLKRN